jgi:hypothetical protein
MMAAQLRLDLNHNMEMTRKMPGINTRAAVPNYTAYNVQ